jgi:hypothetical protein
VVAPKALLFVVVADDTRGWVFPPLGITVFNPTPSAIAFKVKALSASDVFVKPNAAGPYT